MGEPWQRGTLPKESPTTPLGETLPADRGVLGGGSTGEPSTSPPWPTGPSAPLHRGPPLRPASGAAGLHAHLLPTLRLSQAEGGEWVVVHRRRACKVAPARVARRHTARRVPGPAALESPLPAGRPSRGKPCGAERASCASFPTWSSRGSSDATQDQNRGSPSEMSCRFGIPSGWTPRTGPMIGSHTNRHAALTALGSSLSTWSMVIYISSQYHHHTFRGCHGPQKAQVSDSHSEISFTSTTSQWTSCFLGWEAPRAQPHREMRAHAGGCVAGNPGGYPDFWNIHSELCRDHHSLRHRSRPGNARLADPPRSPRGHPP